MAQQSACDPSIPHKTSVVTQGQPKPEARRWLKQPAVGTSGPLAPRSVCEAAHKNKEHSLSGVREIKLHHTAVLNPMYPHRKTWIKLCLKFFIRAVQGAGK